MKKIGLISDTHCCFDEKLRTFLSEVDEIWHAGDIGSLTTADEIAKFKPLRAVYGNIDDHEVRLSYPEFQLFDDQGMRVLMTHIGGYPKHYEKRVEAAIAKHKPKIFISGHSHILKVIYDNKYDVLHINPGAAGSHGFHNVRTAVRFVIDKGAISDLEIGEWKRG